MKLKLLLGYDRTKKLVFNCTIKLNLCFNYAQLQKNIIPYYILESTCLK